MYYLKHEQQCLIRCKNTRVFQLKHIFLIPRQNNNFRPDMCLWAINVHDMGVVDCPAPRDAMGFTRLFARFCILTDINIPLLIYLDPDGTFDYRIFLYQFN